MEIGFVVVLQHTFHFSSRLKRGHVRGQQEQETFLIRYWTGRSVQHLSASGNWKQAVVSKVLNYTQTHTRYLTWTTPQSLLPPVLLRCESAATGSDLSPSDRESWLLEKRFPKSTFPSLSKFWFTWTQWCIKQKVQLWSLLGSLLWGHISSTASCSPFSCCTMQPTLLLKRRDRLPFWEPRPWADLSFFKRLLFLLHIPRMSQILSVPSWEAV